MSICEFGAEVPAVFFEPVPHTTTVSNELILGDIAITISKFYIVIDLMDVYAVVHIVVRSPLAFIWMVSVFSILIFLCSECGHSG